MFQGGLGADDPTTAADFGNGALMQQGFTLLWMGWQWDVPAGRMRMAIPIATEHGQPITGLVRGNFIPGASATVASVADRGHDHYPVVDPESAEHVMYVRTLPSDALTVVPRGRWRFAGPGTVTLEGGFEAGRIYDVVYRARDPRVVGVGLAGTRDLISFFKHATAAEGNPAPGLRQAIGWGVSQTGRFLRHFVYQGFNEDEQGRIVFDGVFDQVGGAGRGCFNHRFGQQSRDQLQHFNIQYPVDMFPFTDEDQTDPVTGVTDGLLARARRTQHRAADVPPAHQLRVLQPRRLARAHRRDRHARRAAARHEPHLHGVVGAAHRRRVSAGAVCRQGLRRPGRHEPAGLHAGHPRALPRARSVDRRRRGAAGEPLSPAGRRHAHDAREGRLARRARLPAAALADDDLSPGLRPGLGQGARHDRAAHSSARRS